MSLMDDPLSRMFKDPSTAGFQFPNKEAVAALSPYCRQRAGDKSRNNEVDISWEYTYIVNMADIEFEWDERKSRANKRKHGISFDEAQTVFLDENALRYNDPDHSRDEDRFIMLGLSIRLRVLIVCHCYRSDDMVIRIISARKATKSEAAAYWR
jgi:uncharacterized DUF497 family protein